MRILKKIFSKSRSLEDGIFFNSLEKILGFPPNELEPYRKAFTHRSSNKLDKQGNPMNYERLEFLGDAMLGSVIAGYLKCKIRIQL
jgi:ribonuclease-3